MKGMEFTEMDIEKLIVIQSVIDGKRTGKEASNKLNLSERQIWRLVKKVKNSGVEGIKHGNRFIHQPRFITFEFKEHIKNLKLSDDYCDANFKHFQELIEEHENIKISYTSIYKILTEKGIKSKKKHKDKKTHRQKKEKIIWVSWFKQMEHLLIGLNMVICIQFMALLMMQQDKY